MKYPLNGNDTSGGEGCCCCAGLSGSDVLLRLPRVRLIFVNKECYILRSNDEHNYSLLVCAWRSLDIRRVTRKRNLS